MPGQFDPSLVPFLVWALGAAGVFYGTLVFAGGHLSDEAKGHLTRWLKGEYQSSWAEQFCEIFDGIFGKHHLSFSCFLRSAVASILAVFAIWALLDPVLGVLTVRATATFDVWHVLLLGALINVIPDYISLYQTRWVLARFRHVRSFWGQAILLLFDFVVTGAIIYLGIAAYLWATGQAQISLVEMVALFSVYSIFFYSTFLTSIWAWAFALSAGFVEIFHRLGLTRILRIGQEPTRQMALVGGAMVFLACAAIKPVVTVEEGGMTYMDAQLCEWFPERACAHAARLHPDDVAKFELLSKICEGTVTQACMERSLTVLGLDAMASAELYAKACRADQPTGCTRLGWMYRTGTGLPGDDALAASLFNAGCEGGDVVACYNLAGMYREGSGVASDPQQALSLYDTACGGGYPVACSNLGLMYREGLGTPTDAERAVALFKEGCDGGNALGCTQLGWMYRTGSGVAPDTAQAIALYEAGCAGGHALGCTNLGLMYETGNSVAMDAARALALYKAGCEGGNARGCGYLGDMYEFGKGGEASLIAAETFYRQGCQRGDDWSCERLEKLEAGLD